MSNQLLHAYKSEVIIAALNNRAFAVIANDDGSESTVVELKPSVPETKENDKNKDGTANKTQGKKKNAETSKTQAEAEENQNFADKESSCNEEIQAVCVTKIDSTFWFAVSRHDKTLSLYFIPSDLKPGEHARKNPVSIYIMPKRSKCISFGVVPPSKTDGKACHVILAGDLSGDAFAYPVPISDAAERDSKNVETASAKPTSTPRRLLLGHTASMLTGLQVVPNDEGGQFILTSDRDEKIRVSHFPKSYVIHGYLLGHTAFISSMAAVAVSSPSMEGGNKKKTICLTGSGDGTVRLWDYQQCKEIGMVPIVLKQGFEDDEMDDVEEANDEDIAEFMENGEEEGKNGEGLVEGEVDDFERGENEEDAEDDEGSCNAHTIAVPISVALSPDAQYAIVARDGIESLDIHPIPPPPPKSSASPLSKLLPSYMVSLHKKQTVECPSQPLDVKFLSDGSVLVLVREPDYLIHYRPHSLDNGGKQTLVFESLNSTSPFAALQKMAQLENIVMPETTLEKDRSGEWKMRKKEDRKELSLAQCAARNKSGENDDDANATKTDDRLHWNDSGRREKARLANQRRRKRKRDVAKTNDEK